MKTFRFKVILGCLLLSFASITAQKFDKKYTEEFKVNPEVTIVVNASYTDVDVETWNKNEVAVEATIEVEGVTKEEAEKAFKKWKFEALGNKNKVKITSTSDFMFFDTGENFAYEFTIPEIHIVAPEIEFIEVPEVPEIPEIPEIPELPELEKLEELFVEPNVDFPDVNIEFFEFDYDKYKNDSTYLKKYKSQIAKEVEKFESSSWKMKIDSIRNSPEFQKKMEDYKKQMEKTMQELKKSGWVHKMDSTYHSEAFKRNSERHRINAEIARKNMEKYRLNAEKARKEIEKNRAEIRAEAHKNGNIHVMKINGKTDTIYTKKGDYFYRFDADENSKMKVKKHLHIKVPKDATFDLNVKHGKLNIPKSAKKISATIMYGDFIAGAIEGSKNTINITNSPVLINAINSSNVTLKNVPNATFGTFSQSNLFANSSDVLIKNVGKNVALSQKFGNLEVLKIVPDFTNLNLIFDYAKGNLALSSAEYIFDVTMKKSTFKINGVINNKSTNKTTDLDTVSGYFKNQSASNKINVTGVYSKVSMK